MIVSDNKVQSKDSPLNALMDSGYEFFLTGSHFFGGSTDKSDFDFFVQEGLTVNGVNGTDVEFWLTNQGYENILKRHIYNDMETVAVYRKKGEWGQIDIQIVKDADTKYKAQRLIKHKMMWLYEKLSKEKRNRLWDFSYMLVNDQWYNDGASCEAPELNAAANQFNDPTVGFLEKYL